MEATHDGLNGYSRVPIALEPRCTPLHMSQVDHFWPKVNAWIKAALAEAVHHELTAQELYRRCKSGECLMVLCWVGEELTGAAVLERSVNQQGDTYVCVVAMGGERLDEWLGEFVKCCRAQALDVGAVRLLIIGRPGWKPYLLAHGAKVRSICMTMEI